MKIKDFVLFVGGFIVFSLVCFAAYNIVVQTQYSPQAEQVTAFKNQLALENLRLQQEVAKQETAKLTAKLAKERAEQERQATIQASPVVVKSRVTLTAFWYFLPILLTGCALLGSFVGLPLYFVLKKVPVKATADGIETHLPARLAAQLSLETTITMRQSAMARTMAFTEDVSQQRFATMIQGVNAFKGVLAKTTGAVMPELPAATEATPAQLAMPTMREIYESLTPGDEMIFGYRMEGEQRGEPDTGTLDKLYSGGTFGESGSGKSAWLRALVTQATLCYPHSRFYILDAHSAHKQSLTNTLPRIPNFIFVDMKKPQLALTEFRKEFQRRIDAGEEALDRPLVMVVDELKRIRKASWFGTLKDIMEDVPTEGRKFGVYLLLSTQDCRINAGFDFRDTLTSLYAFKNKPKQLQVLLQDVDEVQRMKKVTASGVALFAPTEGESVIVKVPFCAPADMYYFEQAYRRQVSGQDVSEGVQSRVTTQQRTTFDTPETHDGHGDAQLLSAALNTCKNDKKILAAAAGVSESLLTKIENETRKMTPETRQKLQAVLAGSSQAASNVIPFRQK